MAKPQHRLVHPVSPKTYANAAVARAIRAGSLVIPLVCEACGQAGTRGGKANRCSILAHHHSYAPEHWLDVIPLCVQCHQWVHHGRVPEPRTGRVYASPIANRRRQPPESYRGRMRPTFGRRRADLSPDEVEAIWNLRSDARISDHGAGQRFGVGCSIVRAIWRERVAAASPAP